MSVWKLRGSPALLLIFGRDNEVNNAKNTDFMETLGLFWTKYSSFVDDKGSKVSFELAIENHGWNRIADETVIF